MITLSWPNRQALFITTYTLAIGAVGAALAYALSFPVFALTGPAILISVVSFTGVRLAIIDVVRDTALLFLGISVGASFDPEAGAAILRWPVAFVGLFFILLAILFVSRHVLVGFFSFDRRSAILAASPGHLSFVLGLSTALNLDITRVAVVQSVRLLALTLIVPLLAFLTGIETNANIVASGTTMSGIDLIGLVATTLLLVLALRPFKVPAPFFIGGMIMSAFSHISDMTPGVLSAWIVLPCFVVLATMIGTRFSGVTLSQLRHAFLAGITTTMIAVVLALAAALPISMILGIPTLQVAIAFSPGGLETMIVMGSIFGANPGFVAACHIGRLMILPLLLPFFLDRK